MSTKLRPDFDKSMNIKDCTKIAARQQYIREISDIRYRLKTDVMTRLKNKEKV